MSSNSTLEAASCRTAPVGGDRLQATCSASSSCSSWIWAMQSPSSRSCSSGPNLRAAIRRAASGGQPPETLPECYRYAASQSLCHSSRWSHTLLVVSPATHGSDWPIFLVSHHHHGADFESEPLFCPSASHKSNIYTDDRSSRVKLSMADPRSIRACSSSSASTAAGLHTHVRTVESPPQE